jgi:hypothetical protein
LNHFFSGKSYQHSLFLFERTRTHFIRQHHLPADFDFGLYMRWCLHDALLEGLTLDYRLFLLALIQFAIMFGMADHGHRNEGEEEHLVDAESEENVISLVVVGAVVLTFSAIVHVKIVMMQWALADRETYRLPVHPLQPVVAESHDHDNDGHDYHAIPTSTHPPHASSASSLSKSSLSAVVVPSSRSPAHFSFAGRTILPSASPVPASTSASTAATTSSIRLPPSARESTSTTPLLSSRRSSHAGVGHSHLHPHGFTVDPQPPSSSSSRPASRTISNNNNAQAGIGQATTPQPGMISPEGGGHHHDQQDQHGQQEEDALSPGSVPPSGLAIITDEHESSPDHASSSSSHRTLSSSSASETKNGSHGGHHHHHSNDDAMGAASRLASGSPRNVPAPASPLHGSSLPPYLGYIYNPKNHDLSTYDAYLADDDEVAPETPHGHGGHGGAHGGHDHNGGTPSHKANLPSLIIGKKAKQTYLRIFWFHSPSLLLSIIHALLLEQAVIITFELFVYFPSERHFPERRFVWTGLLLRLMVPFIIIFILSARQMATYAISISVGACIRYVLHLSAHL